MKLVKELSKWTLWIGAVLLANLFFGIGGVIVVVAIFILLVLLYIREIRNYQKKRKEILANAPQGIAYLLAIQEAFGEREDG